MQGADHGNLVRLNREAAAIQSDLILIPYLVNLITKMQVFYSDTKQTKSTDNFSKKGFHITENLSRVP